MTDLRSRTNNTRSADKACLMDLPRLSMNPLISHPFQQTRGAPLSCDEDYVCSQVPSWPSALMDDDVFVAPPRGIYTNVPIPVELPHMSIDQKSKSFDERSTLSLDKVIDPTSFQVDFDYSCLDLLDEQLLTSPTDSFADICYASTVEDEPISGSSTPRSVTRHHHGDPGGVLANLGYYDDSEDSDDDPTTPVFDNGYESDGWYSPLPPAYLQDIADGQHVTPQYDYYYDDSDDKTSIGQTSFILLGSSYKTRNPGDSVNFFPTSPPSAVGRPKKLPTRLASFCSNLPARLKFGTA